MTTLRTTVVTSAPVTTVRMDESPSRTTVIASVPVTTVRTDESTNHTTVASSAPVTTLRVDELARQTSVAAPVGLASRVTEVGLVGYQGPQGEVGPQGVPGLNVDAALYVQSRGQGLVTNGSGLLGNNTNWSALTFVTNDIYAGFGAFERSSSNSSAFCDENIPVVPGVLYKMSAALKQMNASPQGRFYFAVACYDADGLAIGAQHVLKIPGSRLTRLAAPLNPGDTTITLVDATGWMNAGATHERTIAFYPYSNTKGYTYPTYTYTRRLSPFDAWAPGGLSGNVITLRTPWAGAAWPVNTPVANATSGGTFWYPTGLSNVLTPLSWTRYVGTFGGTTINAPQVEGELCDNYNRSSFWGAGGFRWGTAFVKVGFLLNYSAVPSAITRISAIDFGADVFA